jgi:hypothetical protein
LWLVPVALFLGALSLYLLLPSSFYNPDGLRVFGGLYQVQVDSTGARNYRVYDWTAGYQEPFYTRANVQKHFLFPFHAFVSYRIGQAFGDKRDGLRGLQTANALSAALAVGLFAGLVGALLGNGWAALAAGLGLGFSTAFSSMATNVAEVVPALPWLMLSLLLGRGHDSALCLRQGELAHPSCAPPLVQAMSGAVRVPKRRPWLVLAAGVGLGISACCYFASAAIGVALVIGLASRRRPGRAAILLGSMALVAFAIYAWVLLSGGYRQPAAFGRALFFMPEQGTYGGLKVSNLVTVWLGFANSLFPVLPDDFAGLKALSASLKAGASGHYVSLIALPLIAALAVGLFAVLIRARACMPEPSRRAVFLGLLVFSGALGASLLWDPYHPKLWTYSNIGLWLMFAGFLHHALYSRRPQRAISLTLSVLTLVAVVAANLPRLIQQHRPDPKWTATEQVARTVAASSSRPRAHALLIGGWEPEFAYLTLLLPEPSLVSLPDLALESGRDAARFNQWLDGRIAQVRNQEGAVYFLNTFDRSSDELQAQYIRRLRFPQAVAWIERQRGQASLVWQDPKTGISLYRLNP